jgi:pyruvate/2-oxoglutarate dehydrogenase complex dihydrolipoamide dehydrogenase (E3) component
VVAEAYIADGRLIMFRLEGGVGVKQHRMEKAMAEPERYDTLVLGSGTGGKLVAWQMATTGRRTAVVERRWIGGACPNIACMPSKNEISSARVAHLVRHAAEYGWTLEPGSIDMAVVRKRKRDMVAAQVAKHLENYKASRAELIMGSGRFVAPKTIEVLLNDGGIRVLTGNNVFINVGTHAAIPEVPGLKEARPLTNIEALELDYLPSHLIVLGGGYVGLELAQAYRRFGSRVTVLEQGPQIMGREDHDVAEEIQRILSSEGIEFLLNAKVAEMRGRSGEGLSLTLSTESGERDIGGSHILVAAGRVPNTAGIGLEEADVTLDERGYIRVNEHLETTASGVWALGECAGSPQFTHVAEDDSRIVMDNIAGGKRSTRDRLVPYCMFTDPPLAHVGLSKGEAERQGIAVRVGSLPTSAVLRAQAIGEMQGLMKILVGANDDRILGFTMIGSEAGEVMAVVQTAIIAGLPYTRLRDAVLAHPTMAEGLGFLLASVPARNMQPATP